MSILVLLNGPPASGKSTIAGHLIARQPLTLNLDIDLIRSLLGNWKSRPGEAGTAARRLALAMAREHLGSGHDVIVPQFLARAEFIDQLAETAATVDARFVEIALMMSRSDATEAFQRRSSRPETAQHREAAEAVDAAGGTIALESMFDAFAEMIACRSTAQLVQVTIGDVDGTVARVEFVIDTHRSRTQGAT